VATALAQDSQRIAASSRRLPVRVLAARHEPAQIMASLTPLRDRQQVVRSNVFEWHRSPVPRPVRQSHRKVAPERKLNIVVENRAL
jgi:hypothetical protein